MTLGNRDRELLREGVDLFNEAKFWEAHESWETIWLEAPEPEKRFIQGLIQLTAAFHHFKRGTLSGGIRLVDAATEKLAGFSDDYLGVDRSEATEAARSAKQWARRQLERDAEHRLPSERFPELRFVDPCRR